jgi:hypothetical protein
MSATQETMDLDLHELLALAGIAVAAVVGFAFWLFNRRGK